MNRRTWLRRWHAPLAGARAISGSRARGYLIWAVPWPGPWRGRRGRVLPRVRLETVAYAIDPQAVADWMARSTNHTSEIPVTDLHAIQAVWFSEVCRGVTPKRGPE